MNYRDGKHFLDLEQYEQAFDIFETGAKNGDTKCIYGMIAARASAGKDFSVYVPKLAQAFPELLRSADSNDKDSCFIVARCFEMGLCTEANNEKAIEYYSHAADLGNSDAIFNLGCMYLHKTHDIETAASDYFLASAQLGNADAQFALGFYYEQLKDNQRALLWYSRAAESGIRRMKDKLRDFLSKTQNNCPWNK